MKALSYSILLLLSVTYAFSQTLGKTPKHDFEKIGVYKNANGTVYNEQYFDSLRGEANFYTGKRKIRETEDSVYYSVVQFDKSLTADRYQTEGFYCGNTDRKPLAEIKKAYPYSQTASIKVVSFECCAIPKASDKIDFTKMQEVKTLDADLTNKMMDNFANYKNNESGKDIFMCWNPRNAVMLMNKDERVIAYIEICFECQRYEVSDNNLFGNFCNEKLDAIQGIMMRAGITKGL